MVCGLYKLNAHVQPVHLLPSIPPTHLWWNLMRLQGKINISKLPIYFQQIEKNTTRTNTHTNLWKILHCGFDPLHHFSITLLRWVPVSVLWNALARLLSLHTLKVKFYSQMWIVWMSIVCSYVLVRKNKNKLHARNQWLITNKNFPSTGLYMKGFFLVSLYQIIVIYCTDHSS